VKVADGIGLELALLGLVPLHIRQAADPIVAGSDAGTSGSDADSGLKRIEAIVEPARAYAAGRR